MAVTVEARDTNLVSVGPLIWDKLDITVHYNAVGAWTLTLPATARNWALANTPDLGIVVDWNGVWSFSGFLETYSPSKSIDTNGKVTETITLSGADDLGLVANRIAYPAPASIWAAQTVSSADTQTGPCETVIKHFVNANAGPGALSNRRAPHLTVASDLGRGGTVSYSARFGDGIDLYLMDIIRLLIVSGGPMGVRVVQTGANLVFDTYIPRDLSHTAWFSGDLGNLRAYSLSDSVPTCTNALVRGSATFTEMTGVYALNAWRHVEAVVDQSSSTNATEMAQAGLAAVFQGAGAAQLSITATDLPLLTFGVDYGLGDTITVEVRPGASYTDIVSSVQLVADSSGTVYNETVTPSVGASASDTGDSPLVIARMAAMIRNLELQIRRLQS